MKQSKETEFNRKGNDGAQRQIKKKKTKKGNKGRSLRDIKASNSKGNN